MTLRGRLCRNPAVPGSEPPACGRHGGITNDERRATNDERRTTSDERRTTNDERRTTSYDGGGKSTQGREDARPATAPLTTAPLNTDPLTTAPLTTDHLYFPHPTAAEQRVLATAEAPDLQPEVELVRLVLRRLLAYLDETAGELPPEETRRVAALLFTGARTVALLLGKRPPPNPEMEEWMVKALREMGENYELRITNYELEESSRQ